MKNNLNVNEKENISKEEHELNLDVAGGVSELEILLRRVLPRNILWKAILSKGLEFDGYRDFTPDDDASNIDWKASTRANKMLLKKYVEEKDRKFMFFVDVSENMVFGSTEKIKCEYAAEVASAIAHLILINGDRVGFCLFNNKIVKSRIPELGNRQFDIFVHELSRALNYGGVSDLDNVLESTIKTLDKSTSLVFIVSDFIRMNESYRKNLETLSSIFEIVAIIVRDPLDKTLPNINSEVVIEDAESGERLLVNPRVAKKIYESNALHQLNFVKEVFKDLGIDFIELSTDERFTVPVAEFLKERIKGGRAFLSSKNVPKF
jgi:uncharacterized protein (DUF58 family)